MGKEKRGLRKKKGERERESERARESEKGGIRVLGFGGPFISGNK